jgi:HNH endonuclease
MPKCIFCESTIGPFKTREHILPESLGGGEWAILPDGLFCDTCQNIFGSSIEQQAAGDYPFNQLRILFAIPTKKGKAPWFKFGEGTLTASLRPNSIQYEPSIPFINSLNEGRKTEIRILAHPKKPDMICRFLLKIALEVIAYHDIEDVFKEKYDKARRFALTGEKSGNWWYLQRENLAAVNKRIKTGIKPAEWGKPIELEVVTFKNKAEIFHLKLFYLDMFTPLMPYITPAFDDTFKEPEYRVFTV